MMLPPRKIRVGWYGGSFDPPHLGHQSVVLRALETLDLDTLLVAPAYVHADKKQLAPFNHRLEMVYRMLKRVNGVAAGPTAYACADEWHAYKDGHSPKGLTADTLAYVRRTYAEAGRDPHFVMLVGEDVYDKMSSWEGSERLRAEIAADRLSLQVVPRVDGSTSTLAREALRSGRYAEAAACLPRGVMQYILARGLYVHDNHLDESSCPCRMPDTRRQCAAAGCGACSKPELDADAL